MAALLLEQATANASLIVFSPQNSYGAADSQLYDASVLGDGGSLGVPYQKFESITYSITSGGLKSLASRSATENADSFVQLTHVSAVGGPLLAPEPSNQFNFSPTTKLSFDLQIKNLNGFLIIYIEEFSEITTSIIFRYASLFNPQTEFSGILHKGHIYGLSIQGVAGGGYPDSMSGDIVFTLSRSPAAVPEPSTLWLCGLGIAGWLTKAIASRRPQISADRRCDLSDGAVT